MSRKRGRGLSDSDKALWQKVTDTVDPLRHRPDTPPLAKITRAPAALSERVLSERPLPSAWFGLPTSATSRGTGENTAREPEQKIDRKARRRLERGHLRVDQTLDLHGLTQERAYSRLRRQIELAVLHGNRCVLVITGKGGKRWSQSDGSAAWRTRADFDQHGGVLKAKVPYWLDSPEIAPFVHSYGAAAQSHGGDGALYVMLRRAERIR